MSQWNIGFDVYIIKAYSEGLVEVTDKYVTLTEKGKSEMDNILTQCVSILTENGKDIAGAAKDLSVRMGKTMSPNELLEFALKSLGLSTDLRLMAFLLAEKEMEYKSLVEAIGSTKKKETRFSVVKGTKYDA